MAVAREENFDTLENRVLRAYGDLADSHAREYLERNRTRRQTRRARLVEAFGKRCARMARDLASRGVRRAEPSVTPNFVLQQNPLYHAIWKGWRELLDRERAKDELWRWQARSWEEFCALAVVVALIGMPGARIVASSPLWFREEHRRGRWIEADAPLAVVHLPGSGLIVEVQFGLRNDRIGDLGASLWLRIGSVDETRGFLKRIAVWPLWSPTGGLVDDEAEEVREVLGSFADASVRGGLVVRPAAQHEQVDVDPVGPVLALTLGTEGVALRDGLWGITAFIEDVVKESSS